MSASGTITIFEHTFVYHEGMFFGGDGVVLNDTHLPLFADPQWRKELEMVLYLHPYLYWNAQYKDQQKQITSNRDSADLASILSEVKDLISLLVTCEEEYGYAIDQEDFFFLKYQVAPLEEMLEQALRREERRDKKTKKTDIPKELRWEVFKNDDFTCLHCGTRDNLSVDHIVPESNGGTLDPDNLQTLCKSCNSKKGTKIPEETQ